MQNYNCKTCGAVLYYNAKAGCLECEFCGSRFQAEEFEDATIKEHDEIKDELIEATYSNVDVEEGMVVYECNNCGGTVLAQDNTMATICPYCGEAISITSKSVGLLRPELLIPFTHSKKDVLPIFKNYVSKSFLTPKKFKEENTIEKIQGLYTPFYLHTMDNRSKIVFNGEKTRTYRSGDYRITDHDVYRLSVDAEGHFENIPVDGSVRIENSLMEAIEPFDYNKLTPYNPAYMAGFFAEQTDDDENSIKERAINRCREGMRTKATREFTGYSSLNMLDQTHNISNHVSKYAMLPVWLLNVKHGDKNYKFAINGQTGKITGKLPLSWGKLIALCGGVFVGADIILALLMGFGIL